jgi:hypothetical protein
VRPPWLLLHNGGCFAVSLSLLLCARRHQAFTPIELLGHRRRSIKWKTSLREGVLHQAFARK